MRRKSNPVFRKGLVDQAELERLKAIEEQNKNLKN